MNSILITLSILVFALAVVLFVVFKKYNRTKNDHKKLLKLQEEFENLQLYLRQNEKIIAVRFSVDTYALEKEPVQYMESLSEVMARKLAFAISNEIKNSLWNEIKKRMAKRKGLFICSPVNLEQIIDVRVPLYRADVKNMYLNGENIGGI